MRSKKHRSQYRAWSFEKALEGVESYILIIIKSSYQFNDASLSTPSYLFFVYNL